MTVASSTNSVDYTGNGATTVFSFSFRIFEDSDLVVTEADTDGNETVLVLDTDYTVTGAGSYSGGSITMATAPTNGHAINIRRVLPLTQDTDLRNQGQFFAETHEDVFDRLAMIGQQLQEQIDRSISVPVTSTADAEALSADLMLVADSIADVNTVATNIADVTAVATDIAAVQDASTNMAAIIAAPTEASNAAASAVSASASAAAAAAALAAGMYSGVQDKSSDYTVVAADAGDLIRVDTSGAARTITLPQISTVSDGFKVAIVKWTGDANGVTVARSGSDTINGASSYNVASQYASATFVADFETNQWFAVASGIGTTNVTVDSFNGTGAQTAFTLSGDPGSENNTLVTVSGVYQSKSTYSVSGTTLTFSAAPPSGTGNIEVVWSQPLAIGTPSDGTVTPAKLAADTRSDVASAATVDLTSSAPNTRHINITGTTTITAFTVATGLTYFVRFNASLTLTNNASIVTQTGANIVTQAGDTCILRSTAANTVEVLGYREARWGSHSGSAPLYACRAWVNFNGTGTVAVRASGNVSSITDNGPGDYTVNFTTAMPDADYSVVGAVGGTNASYCFNLRQTASLTTSSCAVASVSPGVSLADSAYVTVSVFR